MDKILCPEISEKHYKNAVLFFIKYCNNSFLGKTKINKLLYYLDFINYRDTNKSVTGDIYIHQEFGPVPSHIDEIIAILKKDGIINTITESYKDSYANSFELIKKSSLDEKVFSIKQLELLKNICHEFGSWTTDKIVSQTHLEAPWFYSKPYDVVDYSYSQDIEFFMENEIGA